MLTFDLIRAAQNNDLAGIAAVVAEMDDKLSRLAHQSASSMASINPSRYADYAQDFRQDASVALFEYLPRWEGDSVDAFRAYIYGAVAAELKQKTYAERNQGADRDALSIFKAMVERADGNLNEAERLAQTEPPKGKRLSADRARAARLAWQGPASLDAPRFTDNQDVERETWAQSMGNVLPASAPEADEIRPKVGHGAALEALKVLQRYAGVSVQRTTPRMFAANLPTLVETLEDTLIVPRDPQQRRYVLDAMAILRSAVSTTADGELAEDLRDASDEARDARALRIAAVREVLDEMLRRMPAQAEALMCSFGIQGRPDFGFGDQSDIQGLMEHLDCKESAVWFRRSNGRAKFAELFIAKTARSEAEAEMLRAAAAAGRARKGRK